MLYVGICLSELARFNRRRNEWKSRLLEMNASDDRGIQVVRDKIKSYARTLVSRNENLPPWKVIILDEADMLTNDAQAALRRVLEDYTESTRFVFLCNYISRIIPPLQSRCAVYRFEPVEADTQRERLMSIARREGVVLDTQAVDRILEISEGDMRTSITLLETTASWGQQVTQEMVENISGMPPLTVATSLLETCRSGSSCDVEAAVVEIRAAGWDVNQVLVELSRLIVKDTATEFAKAAILTAIATSQSKLVDGGSAFINLLECSMETHSILLP